MAIEQKKHEPHWVGWQTVRTESASARIVDQVWTALFRGELKPGDYLGSEVQLAQKLGLSRVPVRDAFRTLQALGIVDVKVGARGGARIAAGDANRFASALAVQLKLIGISIEEMFDAQIAIEVMAAELAAKRATTADLATLRSINDELLGYRTSSPLFTEKAMRFHEALIDAAHNRALSAQFKALRSVLEPVYAQRISATVVKRVVGWNRQIIEAIAAADTGRAGALMRHRLEVIRARQLMKAVEN